MGPKDRERTLSEKSRKQCLGALPPQFSWESKTVLRDGLLFEIKNSCFPTKYMFSLIKIGTLRKNQQG